MIFPLVIASVVICLTIVVQVFTINYLLRWFASHYGDTSTPAGIRREAFNLSIMMMTMFIGHVLQIAIWAFVFWIMPQFEDFETAFYHSAVNFTSLGYGDIVVENKTLRVLGPLEAANGILMFGLTAALYFAILSRVYKQHFDARNSRK